VRSQSGLLSNAHIMGWLGTTWSRMSPNQHRDVARYTFSIRLVPQSEVSPD